MAIRAYRRDDEPALYDVCLRTGADGHDATAFFRDPRLLGGVFVGPYLALHPELAFVLDDGSGAGGYVLGALDTRDFEARCEASWWPGLRAVHPLAEWADDAPERWVAEWIHHPPRTPARFVADYPAHLHIDLLPHWQGAGWGGKLMGAMTEALAARGSTGVHVGVSPTNARALAFYRKLGFQELGQENDAVFLGLPL
jgi:ribosomal protein S18 acetylase RimI-like enzyme